MQSEGLLRIVSDLTHPVHLARGVHGAVPFHAPAATAQLVLPLLLLNVSAMHVSCFVLVGKAGLLRVPFCRGCCQGVVSCCTAHDGNWHHLLHTPHILQHSSLASTSVITCSTDNGKAGMQ